MTRELTARQDDVVTRLRRVDKYLALIIRDAWIAGREWYIDTRVPLPRGLRRAFREANVDATSATT